MKNYIIYLLRALLIVFFGVNIAYVASVEKVEAWGVIMHSWFAPDHAVQSYVQYAYEISGWDMDFVTTLSAENWGRDPNLQSYVIDKNTGKREDSRGFCQFHRAWHSDKVDDPRFFADPYRQLDRCWDWYSWGTKFYWYYVRHKEFHKFTMDWVVVPKTAVSVLDKKPSYVQPWNPYKEARELQDKIDAIKKEIQELPENERKVIEKWRVCIDTWYCKD